MTTPPIPPTENARLSALRDYRILDTQPEQAYDDITTMAAFICGTPAAMLSLVDETRQWFKAKVGVDEQETPRDVAFCAHAIHERNLMLVPDARKDERFVDNPLVTRGPRIRFYAGVPLVNPEGHALGALCVVDHKPRRLGAKPKRALEALARLVLAQMELRRVSARLAGALEDVKVLEGLLPICMYCKQIRDDKGYWNKVEAYIGSRTSAYFTHGICPACLEKHMPELVKPGES